MRYEKRGFREVSGAPESVAAVIGIGRREIFRRVFVNHRLRDDVLFARPIPEIEYAAALAAERKFSVSFRIGGFLTNGAIVLHVD